MADGSITTHSVYNILSAVVPLYIAIFAGYFLVKVKLFSPADIAGINRFVVLVAIPVLSFRFIASIDLYTISYRLILADTLFKLLVLGGLAAYGVARRHLADLDWLITLWMIATLSNTLIVGVPTLLAMYGPMTVNLIGQVVVGQAVIWYPGLMLLYEVRASWKEESRRAAEAEGDASETPLEDGDAPLESGEELKAAMDWEQHRESGGPESLAKSCEVAAEAAGNEPGSLFVRKDCRKLARVAVEPGSQDHLQLAAGVERTFNSARGVPDDPAEDFRLHIEPDSDLPSHLSPPEPASDRQPAPHLETSDSKLELQHLNSLEFPCPCNKPPDPPETKPSPTLRGQLSLVVRNRSGSLRRENSRAELLARRRRTLKILGWKLRKSFTVHAAILGLVYSLVAYKSGFGLPLIVRNSLDILGNTGVGMTMFSLGMFMGSTAIFPCGLWLSLAVHSLRFVIGPALMGVISLAVGLRGDTLRVAIIQAALPQAIVSFSFAKEYDAYPEVLSTSITFGTLVSFPVALIYYAILGCF